MTQSIGSPSIQRHSEIQFKVDGLLSFQNFMVLSELPVTNMGSMNDLPIMNFQEFIVSLCPVSVFVRETLDLVIVQILIE
mmetsp:Transcript_8537/g.9677  ORF Transcript_8537/g.9677 Transcript_8537/m.9677 type:complete len:80 (+) Transcript_8537:673-912(+)